MVGSMQKWFGRLLGVVILVGLGTGLWFGGMWYAHRTMKMPSTGMESMPGMNMTSSTGEQEGSSTTMEGYTEVRISGDIQQQIGVTVGEVKKAPLEMSVRTVGVVQLDETRVAHLHIKTEGWVEKLFVNFTGQTVNKGDPLLAVYSPEFLSTQQDFLIARRGENRAGLADVQQSLADAALRRLELWDVPPEEIEELERTGKPQKSLTLRSPMTGTVLEKDAFEGIHVTPERELYVVGDLSSVWVQAKVYEHELPHVEKGHPVKVQVPALPDRELEGTVDFIEPTLEETTRTVRVRVELPNPDGLLKPGMFVHIEIMHTMGDGLLIPASSVLRTGERDIVFRIESENRFLPVDVKLSPMMFGEQFQVLEGLSEGDKVVTSANFLIDSESRLRAGGGSMAGMAGMDMGAMPEMQMKGMDHSKMKH